MLSGRQIAQIKPICESGNNKITYISPKIFIYILTYKTLIGNIFRNF